jgi:hypothetical protein
MLTSKIAPEPETRRSLAETVGVGGLVFHPLELPELGEPEPDEPNDEPAFD